MSSKKESASSGIGLGSLIFVLFLALKLGGIGPVATWSWWWVTAPLWMPAAIVLSICGIVLVGAGILAAVAK